MAKSARGGICRGGRMATARELHHEMGGWRRDIVGMGKALFRRRKVGRGAGTSGRMCGSDGAFFTAAAAFVSVAG